MVAFAAGAVTAVCLPLLTKPAAKSVKTNSGGSSSTRSGVASQSSGSGSSGSSSSSSSSGSNNSSNNSSGNSSSSSSSSSRALAVESKNNSAFVIIAAQGMEELALRLVAERPGQFSYVTTNWGRFPDGTDNIKVNGFTPMNLIRDRRILFLANFETNDITLSQYYVIVMLLESFIQDMTILLPFFPTATMERVTEEGVVATANTLSRMLSCMPLGGRPTRVMVYDLHTMQNRFYVSGCSLMTTHTAFPLLVEKIRDPRTEIDAVAFPDDGAAKRFGYVFKTAFPSMELVTCGKHRDESDASKRVVVIQDGDPRGKHLIIIDDLVQSGGTLYQCALALKQAGARKVSAYCTHAVFPKGSWKRFAKGGDMAVFEKFYVSNSRIGTTKSLPTDDCFEVLDLLPQILEDL
jgi:phosphoribosylpyrophosphate synthetase